MTAKELVEGIVKVAREPLRAYWSKREHDVMIGYPRKCDGHWLSGVFNKAFTDELTARGYDVTTMRFSIQQIKVTTKDEA
jgi:hypothetical protein